MTENRRFRPRRLALTPLVDVIFLLLLFFMLTASFRDFGSIEISSATSNGPAVRQHLLRIAETELSLDGRAIEIDRLAGAAEGVRRMIVSVDDATTAQRLVDVLGRLRTVEGLAATVLR